MEEKNIYSKLREVRRSRGLTVNKLAEKMGEDHQKVGRIERGRRSLTLDYLMKVSKALDIQPESFLKEEEKSSQENPQNASLLLNDIVVLVEEKNSQLQRPLNAKQKGTLVSKLYEQASQFPPAQREQFLKSFLDTLLAIST
ncbi:helix-turn-helix domain-containing protein [Candidatus Neptunochlamydia vexilliferae]|nr:helix-turn-helix transcriptional regulator [Candidatus Neptunochlamydia vexilliferae]